MRIFITGGAGFIGVNCVKYFADKGHEITVFDNLSREGSDKNLKWVSSHCRINFVNGDLKNFSKLKDVFIENGPFELILHMAAQVAVTTSVLEPRDDFETNAIGTFNLLEAVRKYNPEAILIYASTNKVYGNMNDLDIVEKNGRYEYHDLPKGIDENRNLDFHSPYGCSKGAADQYCRDYHRIYGLKTIVMRQSCIYGYRQFGIEDQGWVAWFCIAAALNKKITIFGDGKQIRDVLFIDDLVRAYELSYEKSDDIAGEIYNIGGGPGNTLSLHELIERLENIKGDRIPIAYNDWRPGDQKVFIGDIQKAYREFSWRPKIGCDEGIERLYRWVEKNKQLFI